MESLLNISFIHLSVALISFSHEGLYSACRLPIALVFSFPFNPLNSTTILILTSSYEPLSQLYATLANAVSGPCPSLPFSLEFLCVCSCHCVIYHSTLILQGQSLPWTSIFLFSNIPFSLSIHFLVLFPYILIIIALEFTAYIFDLLESKYKKLFLSISGQYKECRILELFLTRISLVVCFHVFYFYI